MEKIELAKRPLQDRLENAVILERSATKKVVKSLINSSGIIVGIFLIFAVVVITTTDLRLVDFGELASIGVDFFLLIFVSYFMFVTCSDSGMRSGLVSERYIKASSEFEEKKKRIIESGIQERMHEFCSCYVIRELKSARMNILASIGFSYDKYALHWMSKGDSDVELSRLSKSEKAAIKAANSVKPVRLSPDMIMTQRRGTGNRRKPLGINPYAKKRLGFGKKFISSVVVAGLVTIVSPEITQKPSWAVFTYCILKLISVVVSGVQGYKFGFENIVFDTIDYISNQIYLMDQAILYVEENPVPKEKEGSFGSGAENEFQAYEGDADFYDPYK